MEFIRTHLPIIAFPWNLSGYAASGNLAFLQLTVLTGIYGLSFLIGAFNALLAWAIWRRDRRSLITLASVTAALLLVAIVGPHFVPSQAPRYVAHLVQTNFPQSESYPSDWLDRPCAENWTSSKRSAWMLHGAQPGLVVWPEVPAPFSFTETKFAERAQRIARESASEFLVGVVDWKKDAGQAMAGDEQRDSAESVRPADFHLRQDSSGAFRRIRAAARISDFCRAADRGHFRFHAGNGISRRELPGGKFGVFICYEAIFPSEVRHFAANGAELLINHFE